MGRVSGSRDRRRHVFASAAARVLAISVFLRIVLDTAIQMFSPFFSLIAAGAQLSTTALGQMIALRNLTGLTAPLFGAWALRFGYLRIIQGGLVGAGLGLLLIASASASGRWTMAAGLLLLGFGMVAVGPSLYSHLSEQSPYSQRARYLGTLECSRAIAGIVGLSAVGWWMERAGWNAPFLLLGLLLVGAAGAVPFMASPNPSTAKATDALPRRQMTLSAGLAYLETSGTLVPTLGLIALNALNLFAATQLTIVHGAWLNEHFAFGPSALGLSAILLGLADLCGDGFVALFGDRVGIQRCLRGATLLSLLAFGLAATAPSASPLALLTLASIRFCSEIAFTSGQALLSELVPEIRALLISTSSSVLLLFGGAGAALGPWVFARWGIAGVGGVSASAVALASLASLLLVHLRQPTGAVLER